MAKIEIDLDPIVHITADAIGQPGSRVFYLQAWAEAENVPVTIIVEKIQLQGLALGIEQMVSELARQKPELKLPPIDYDPTKMSIQPPVDPLFRAGEIALGYDIQRDRMIIQVDELLAEDVSEEEGRSFRLWCTRAQARQLSHWAEEVINRGRPICPQCGQPMEPEGHFCPKKNGNKKK